MCRINELLSCWCFNPALPCVGFPAHAAAEAAVLLAQGLAPASYDPAMLAHYQVKNLSPFIFPPIHSNFYHCGWPITRYTTCTHLNTESFIFPPKTSNITPQELNSRRKFKFPALFSRPSRLWGMPSFSSWLTRAKPANHPIQQLRHSSKAATAAAAATTAARTATAAITI